LARKTSASRADWLTVSASGWARRAPVAIAPHRRRPEDVADLLRDGRKHLGGRQPVSDQRGDAVQRGLLVGEHAQLLLAALGTRGRQGFELTAARGQRAQSPQHRVDAHRQ
jgi:hypothetical protein